MVGNVVVFGNKMQYYNIEGNWSAISPFLNDSIVQTALVKGFNKYTYGRSKKRFKAGMLPSMFDWSTLRYENDSYVDEDDEQIRPFPEFFNYVCNGASIWLANFNLALAMMVEPQRPWRIIYSDDSATVFDGDITLFDFNFLAFGNGPDLAFEAASGTELPPGVYMKNTPKQ